MLQFFCAYCGLNVCVFVATAGIFIPHMGIIGCSCIRFICGEGIVSPVAAWRKFVSVPGNILRAKFEFKYEPQVGLVWA